ncbi:MBL fold metallo-hydrolase RNA specificity domain-containing protein [Effusibacillus lacus]|uniref:MBL fold hydrolase n=1 Tax=Effusibacillus lacus TaxID=1348429 RepID=A0A292YLL0_9BACL|nr:MBL fold metallo-hydrolase [Effusibacillus lacus]TCS75370.1 metallo-beta-lactamase family protein [Effusibacillus lacus]GAX89801.1 MBL fold hydrolase [Effusibacillus lacus]
MRILFVGGAKTVTGSCYLIETQTEKLLVDCGMFQGSKELEELNFAAWPFHPGEISYVLLTHAHIDHSGLLPKLKRDGFRGQIICTKSTFDLCSIMLPDSGHIHETEYEWNSRKHSRQRKKPKKEPLYTQADAFAVLKNFVSVPYHQVVELSPTVSFRMMDAGHILGSAIIELWIKENGQTTKLVFSGDIGSTGQAIVRDPERVEEADYIFVESTYGNRLHPPVAERSEQLLSIIREAQKDNGLVIIPAFAVGRTQEILFQLHKLFKKGLISDIPVYVDSPLAVSATRIVQSNPDYYDEETTALFKQGDNPLAFPGLRFISSQEESQRLNFTKGTAIIISASGMAEAGRIKHHLKHQLWKENNHVVFAGYQAEGSLGRKLLSGANRVRVLGQNVRVGAKIHDLSAMSAHADKEQLLNWLKGFRTTPKQVFVVHGEEESSREFAHAIELDLGWKAHVPSRGETVYLEGDQAPQIDEPKEPETKQTVLSEAELDAYMQAIEHNVDGLVQALGKYGLTQDLLLKLSERLIKVNDKLEDLSDQL